MCELWKSQKFTIVASCAGQIPAALAATTESLDDLVEAAPEIVATAVRAGLDVDQRTNAFNDDRSKSWATAVGVPLAQAQQVAATFNKNKVSKQVILVLFHSLFFMLRCWIFPQKFSNL